MVGALWWGSLSQGRACGHPWKVWKVKRGGQFGRENCAAVHLITPLLPCCGVKVQRAKWLHDVLTQVAWLKMQVWLTHKIINFALHQILQLMSVLWCQRGCRSIFSHKAVHSGIQLSPTIHWPGGFRSSWRFWLSSWHLWKALNLWITFLRSRESLIHNSSQPSDPELPAIWKPCYPGSSRPMCWELSMVLQDPFSFCVTCIYNDCNNDLACVTPNFSWCCSHSMTTLMCLLTLGTHENQSDLPSSCPFGFSARCAGPILADCSFD